MDKRKAEHFFNQGIFFGVGIGLFLANLLADFFDSEETSNIVIFSIGITCFFLSVYWAKKK